MENNEKTNRNDDQDLQKEIRESERNPDFETNLDGDADERLKQQRVGQDQLGLDSDEFDEIGNDEEDGDSATEYDDDATSEEEDDMVENLDEEEVPEDSSPTNDKDQVKGSDADYYK